MDLTEECNAEISGGTSAPISPLYAALVTVLVDSLSNPIMYRHCDAEMALRNNGASISS